MVLTSQLNHKIQLNQWFRQVSVIIEFSLINGSDNDKRTI
jgi:hypothetical protein